MRRPGFAAPFCEASAEFFAHGSEGLVKDSELLYRAWVFDVRQLKRRVHLWQGLDDRLVPAVIKKEVADHMPGAVWHPVPGAGHFVAIVKAEEMFGIAAEELSQNACSSDQGLRGPTSRSRRREQQEVCALLMATARF